MLGRMRDNFSCRDRMQRRGSAHRPRLGVPEPRDRLILILGLRAFLVLSGVESSAAQQHTGLECVIQVDLQYDEKIKFAELRRSLGEFLFRDGRANSERSGGPSVAWDSPRLLYFFLDNDCETRVDRVRAILLGYRSSPNAFELGFNVSPVTEPSKRLQQNLRLQERYGSPKFTRRQCIVEIDIVGGADSRYWNSASMGNPYNFLLSYGKRHHSRLSLFSFSGGSDRFHILFHDRCDRRIEMAWELVSAYMARYPTGPRFFVLNKFVDPGPDTIDVTGREWIDTAEPTKSRTEH